MLTPEPKAVYPRPAPRQRPGSEKLSVLTPEPKAVYPCSPSVSIFRVKPLSVLTPEPKAVYTFFASRLPFFASYFSAHP